MNREAKPQTALTVAVVGGGAVGLVTALGLARAGFAIELIAPPAPAPTGRTVALFDGSVRLLRALGVWDAIAPRAAPMERMTIVDDSGSLFAPPPVTFSAGEIGLDAFGWNIDLVDLWAALGDALRAEPAVDHRATAATGFSRGNGGARLALADGAFVDAAVIVAADGGRSVLREAAGIGARAWSYPQTALTATVAHAREHRFVSTEFHTRQGPCTFVPLPGRRSSVVWVTTPERAEPLIASSGDELARAIERQSQFHLGAMRMDGPRGLVPLRGLTAKALAAPGLYLAGEAAHVLPPIGAQGLNLGLRDAAHLVDILADARDRGEALDGEAARARYESARRIDVGLRGASVDLINRTLLADFLPADFLRGASLVALDHVAPLRRFVMRMGIGPPGRAPRLMRADA